MTGTCDREMKVDQNNDGTGESQARCDNDDNNNDEKGSKRWTRQELRKQPLVTASATTSEKVRLGGHQRQPAWRDQYQSPHSSSEAGRHWP